MSTTISTLVPYVQNRLEEDPFTTDGEFWSIQFEIRAALVEAMNDLMVLVGRPTQTVDVPFSLTPNTVWQTIPAGVLLITNVRGFRGDLRRVTLHDMDYVQSSWGADWEADTDPNGPARWFPLGVNMFGVHPAASVSTTVTLDAIAYPVTATYPYIGTESIPFHDEMFASLEEYAAHYSRIKEGSQEAQQALGLYQSYLASAKRLSMIEDRRDPVIFSPSFGASSGIDSLTKR